MNIDPILALYALPLAIVWTVYLGLRKRAEWRSITRRQAAAEATPAASLSASNVSR